jgi:glutathione-regulated potassium-efflux system protein KefB
VFTATVIVSMVVTPFTVFALRWVLPRQQQSMDGVEAVPDGLRARVLLIGFGRFGQIASQPLLARKHQLSIIDNDTDMIRAATQLGMKVYYGDGTRLDILRSAGAGTADIILVCVDSKESTTRITELIHAEFPQAKIMARAYDRGHALSLMKLGVDFQIRETFESALVFGGEVLRQLGAEDDDVAEVIEGVRDRDRERFRLQAIAGWQAGRDLLLSNAEDQAREQGIQPPTPEEQALPAEEGAR